MRLYTLTGATVIDDASGHYEADEHGAFEFPQHVADRLHSFHIGGKPQFENDAERARRLVAEDLERMRDPATLLKVMEAQNVLVASALSQTTVPAPTPSPHTPADAQPAQKRAPRRAPTPKAAPAD